MACIAKNPPLLKTPLPGGMDTPAQPIAQWEASIDWRDPPLDNNAIRPRILEEKGKVFYLWSLVGRGLWGLVEWIELSSHSCEEVVRQGKDLSLFSVLFLYSGSCETS